MSKSNFKTLFSRLFITVFIALFLGACGKSGSCVDPDLYQPGVSCPPYYNPVCGCDDVEYRNECEAERNGVTFWISGQC